MKKYMTTIKHEIFPEGLIFSQSIYHDNFMACAKGAVYVDKDDFEIDLAKGMYKEIQEPKWTNDDMIKFHLFLVNRYDNDLSVNTYEELFEEYKKSKQ